MSIAVDSAFISAKTRATFALTCAFRKFGTAIAARMPIIATTISNSISVKARFCMVSLFQLVRDLPKRNTFAVEAHRHKHNTLPLIACQLSADGLFLETAIFALQKHPIPKAIDPLSELEYNAHQSKLDLQYRRIVQTAYPGAGRRIKMGNLGLEAPQFGIAW